MVAHAYGVAGCGALGSVRANGNPHDPGKGRGQPAIVPLQQGGVTAGKFPESAQITLVSAHVLPLI